MTRGGRITAAIGAFCLLAGLLLGVTPVHAGETDCGSWISPKEVGTQLELFGATCDSERGTRRTASILFFVVGGGFVIWGVAGVTESAPRDPASGDGYDGA